jgi:hypothetical protein
MGAVLEDVATLLDRRSRDAEAEGQPEVGYSAEEEEATETQYAAAPMLRPLSEARKAPRDLPDTGAGILIEKIYHLEVFMNKKEAFERLIQEV